MEPPLRMNEVPRGDSPILGIYPAQNAKEENEIYGKPRPPPLTPPPPIPRDRVIRGQGKQTVRPDLPFRPHPDNPARRGSPSLPPQPVVQPVTATQGGESIVVDAGLHTQTQGRVPPRSDVALKRKETGVYNESQEDFRNEDGMPLEVRLRRLEGLVRRLEAENAKAAERMLAKRVRPEGHVVGLTE